MLPIILKNAFQQGIQCVYVRRKWCIIGVNTSSQNELQHINVCVLKFVADVFMTSFVRREMSVTSLKI